jgi:hypothetical protein
VLSTIAYVSSNVAIALVLCALSGLAGIGLGWWAWGHHPKPRAALKPLPPTLDPTKAPSPKQREIAKAAAWLNRHKDIPADALAAPARKPKARK